MTENVHYSKIPEHYHSSFFYAKDSPYEKWQVSLIVNTFRRGKVDSGRSRFVDLGGGTGRFTNLVRNALELKGPVSCVDLSKEMLSQAQGYDGIHCVNLDALTFAMTVAPNSFDLILLKEVIHHVSPEKLPEFFCGLLKGTSEEGTCVIVTRPRVGINYPFMSKAVKIWEKNQTEPDEIRNVMISAGFKNVELSSHSYPVSISIEEWIQMIRRRMWSTFSEENFSYSELEEEISKTMEKYEGSLDQMLHFDEVLIIISATS